MSDKQKPDAPQFFVSRRGRKVGLHEVDLKGIDIEADQPSEVVSAETPRQKSLNTSPDGPKRPRPPRKSWSKRKKATLAVIVLIIAALPLLLGEALAAQYRGGIQGAKDDMAQLINERVLPQQKKASISADGLRTIAGDVDAIVGKMCRGGMLDNAASLYPRAKTAHDECKTAQSDYSSLAKNLYGLESQARYLERLDAILKPVVAPITDEYAVIGAQRSAWGAAAESVSKLSPPAELASAHQELATHVKALAEGWAKLDSANASQDAESFTAAEQTLTNEYEAVRNLGMQLAVIVGDSQAKVTAAYNSLQ